MQKTETPSSSAFRHTPGGALLTLSRKTLPWTVKFRYVGNNYAENHLAANFKPENFFISVSTKDPTLPTPVIFLKDRTMIFYIDMANSVTTIQEENLDRMSRLYAEAKIFARHIREEIRIIYPGLIAPASNQERTQS